MDYLDEGFFCPGTKNEHVFTTHSKLALGSHLSNLKGIYHYENHLEIFKETMLPKTRGQALPVIPSQVANIII